VDFFGPMNTLADAHSQHSSERVVVIILMIGSMFEVTD
jgi:hypothetical protein